MRIRNSDRRMRDFSFSIDRGGTFTDVFAECPDRQYRVLKLLSEDPSNYDVAPREGIRRILEQVTGQPHPRDQKLDTSRIASIRMGTTVATNALPAGSDSSNRAGGNLFGAWVFGATVGEDPCRNWVNFREGWPRQTESP